MAKATVGVIGGSGFYQFLKGNEIIVDTPYGRPSNKILITKWAGKKIAFLPRHGKKHQYPPHRINYRANLFALKKIGCQRIIAPAAVGSLKPQIKPGHFVICDQFIDRTKIRKDTYFDGPKVAHISCDHPYCPEMRKIAVEICQKFKIYTHKTGVVVVIEGPRFSTKAESRFNSRMGWDVINMTQYPEVVLARELEMCYLNISLVTDYDVGLRDQKAVKPVTTLEIIKVFQQNNEKIKKVILEIIEKLPGQKDCQCHKILKSAKI